MAAYSRCINPCLLAAIVLIATTGSVPRAHGQLSTTFYATTCPTLSATVLAAMTTAVAASPRMGASILRLHFHDCFVNGCDGSVLLDDTPTFTGEKTAFPNNNSLRGFEVIDSIKAQLEVRCPGVVSCADILAVAARDGTVLLGGPTWIVPLGRRDARNASRDTANTDLPAPTLSLSGLNASFATKNLSSTDLAALSGAHTIGQAQCLNFQARLTNDTNINPAFRTLRQRTCGANSSGTNLAPLDVTTPTVFDNAYYRNLVQQRGLLHSDQELFNNGTLDALVRIYATNPVRFRADFAAAMVKMGNLGPLTGTQGEIRLNCRKMN